MQRTLIWRESAGLRSEVGGVPYRRVVIRLMRWNYRCGECHRDYDLPGADLSFFYGWFLGVSPCADAVAFDTVSFLAFDELQELIGSLGQELPQKDPSRWTARALTEVCDPDTRGDRYVFSGTPRCPTCTSMQVKSFTATQQPWEHKESAATHVQWDSMSRSARLDRLRVSLGLLRRETRATSISAASRTSTGT
jgi:hypothetical protein